MKRLDLGNSDFKSIIENDNYFVDKSLFIKEIIDCQSQVILLPRPRRFGKTMNLSMLNYYFDRNQPKNKELFYNLKIWKTESVILEKQGKYPVIYLSFKDAKSNTWEHTYKKIIFEIVKAYSVHDYLLESVVLKNHEKKVFNDILNRQAEVSDFENSLIQLSDFLYRYHNEKTIILIDEYDSPIQVGYKLFYNDVISFMRNLLSGAFKDNKYLYKGVITGILRISKESIFSGLNNLGVYTIFEEKFSECFGFLEAEVKQIMTHFEVSTAYQKIKKWYNGYKFGNTSDIYNPWSILNYACEYKSGFRPFWVNTSSDALLREQLKNKGDNFVREQLLKLVNNEPIEKTIEENFVFPDLDTDKELIWALLLFSGYLTTFAKTGRKTYAISIPNYEIKTVFQDIVLKWLNTDIKIKQTLLLETTKYLVNNDITKFEKGFKEIIGDTFSYFDTQKEPENVYQAYVLGLLAIIGDDYIIRSNRESGEGRYDILLIPHDKTKNGIVIEIKQIRKNKSEKIEAFHKRINSKIDEARTQIEENNYYKELIENKVNNIIKLPIVFVGKEPYINLIDKKI